MVKEELVKRSPLRIFEKTLHGGLQAGQIGVITSKEGVGKTGCLVHLAVDKMFQGKHVIHVSFASKPDNILNWYEDIFNEISEKKDLENAIDVHDKLVHNRVVMSFPQGGIPLPSVLKSVENMISQAHFQADLVILDSLDFSKVSKEDLGAIKAFASSINIGVWISVSLQGQGELWDSEGIPQMVKPYLDSIDILIDVKHKGDYIHLELAKEGGNTGLKDMNLKLDPNTLLISEK